MPSPKATARKRERLIDDLMQRAKEYRLIQSSSMLLYMSDMMPLASDLGLQVMEYLRKVGTCQKNA
jgi:hypothetical protein